MAACCGREGESRGVGKAVWLLVGLVLLGVWVARQFGWADAETPSRSAAPANAAKPHSGDFGK